MQNSNKTYIIYRSQQQSGMINTRANDILSCTCLTRSVLTSSPSGRKYRVVALREMSVGINRAKVSRGCVKKTSFYVPGHVPAVAGVLWVNVDVGQIYWSWCGAHVPRNSMRPAERETFRCNIRPCGEIKGPECSSWCKQDK